MSMDGPQSLANRVALITGAGSGIGRAAALNLAADGAHVLVLDLNPGAAQDTVAAIQAAHGNAHALHGDVADTEAMRALVARALADHGSIDILVNNAAMGGGGVFADVTEETFDRLFAVNVRGAFFLAQAVVPSMTARRFGRIINVSSLIAARGTAGNPHYAGAKAALFGFMRSWAIELAPHGITVNAVVPALTATPMATAAMTAAELTARGQAVPMGRLGTPAEIAALIGFLCQPGSSFLTGQAISPNGGEYVGAL